jgi:eukaryotic-like serine/threonine-protein kinase
MPAPTPDELWQLLVRTRLLAPDAVISLRADHAAAVAAGADGSVKGLAGWLMSRGVITRWQAKRLVIGDTGPFVVGDYRLLERHEREGDGLLFTARHEPTGRLVTLMLLNAKRCRDRDVWTSIVARTAAAHATTDPMTTRTWSLEQQDGATFIVCELVAGANVADELDRLGPLPPQQAGVLAWQIAKAVGELHARGAVHGQLSLDALRREPPPPGGGERNGRVRLLQFPLAGDPHALASLPAGDVEAGLARLGRRAAYLAPELMQRGGLADARGDVYAVGGMLHALLSGQPPHWDGGAVTAVKAAAALGPAPLPDSVPPALRDVVATMLARDPADRYADGRAAAAALADALGLAMPAEEPAVTVVAPTARPATRAVAARPRAGRWLAVIGGLAAGAVLVGLVAFVMSRTSVGPVPGVDTSKRTPPRRVASPRDAEPAGAAIAAREPAGGGEPTATKTTQRPEAGGPAAPPPPAAVAEEIVDSPDLPWASPTHGRPPTLAYLPPGSQLVLLARLAALEADEEGRLFRRSLGPAAEAACETLVNLCGGNVAAIDLVQAGWQADGPDEVVGGFTVWFAPGHAAPAAEAARAAAWGPTTTETIEGETVHHTPTLSLWTPARERGRALVVAPRIMVARADAIGDRDAEELLIARIIRETKPLAEDDSTHLKAALPRDLETLVGMLDADRHLTIWAAPHFLLTSGRPVLAGPLEKLAEPLDSLFGNGLQAVALSLHFGPAAYVEMDAVATLDVPPKTLAPAVAGRVEGLADRVEAYCTALSPDPYGRVLVLRLPAMLRVLAAQLRSGAEGKGVVLNAYLPRHAPHNIALAAELALAQTPGAAVASGSPPPAPTSTPQGALGRLGRTMTLNFAKDNLERSIQMVSEETGVPMEILGGDLQLEGITKNQSFGLDEHDKTADEILRVILAKSNPEGKLVYVVKEKDGEEWVLITTRAAAEKRGDTLPPAFAPTK